MNDQTDPINFVKRLDRLVEPLKAMKDQKLRQRVVEDIADAEAMIFLSSLRANLPPPAGQPRRRHCVIPRGE